MKVLIIYRPDSEHARKVDEFVHEFKRLHPGPKVDLLSLNTRDGAAMASIYDIVQYPAILALAIDGQVLNAWQGEQLPLMNEVAAYAAS